MVIATKAPEWAFVHAGAVAVGDQAIVLPGRTFAGKTTLVAALIRRGATYLSDEYAVLDDDGLVHPYPAPLSIRAPTATIHSPYVPPAVTAPSAFGATTGTRPLPIGLIVATDYRPDADWAPESRSPAQGALILLANALAAREEPQRLLGVVRRAAAHAVVLEGVRGDADVVAEALIARANSGLQRTGE
jgi:hypothetical protein